MSLPLSVLRKLMSGYAAGACPNCHKPLHAWSRAAGFVIRCRESHICGFDTTFLEAWDAAMAEVAALLRPFARQAESVIEEASEDEGEADEWFVTGLPDVLATVGDYRRLAALYKELPGERSP